MGCNKKHQSKSLSYFDYKNDKLLLQELSFDLECEKRIEIIKQIKTIDIQQKSIKFIEGCKNNIDLLKGNNDSIIIDEFNSILNDDQSVRVEFNDYMNSTTDLNFNGENFDYVVSERKRIWDSITGKTDSINRTKMANIIERLGEWPGAEYISNQLGNPKLEVIVGHMPEEDYKNYTLMAYKSATLNKEYWHRIESLIGFSSKYIIEDMEYFKIRKIIVPLRFYESNSDNRIKEGSDLTYMEFFNVVNKKDGNGNNIKLKLHSSLENENDRTSLMNQAKELLISYNKEIKSSDIIISNDKEKHTEYELYYEFLHNQ